MKLYKKQLAVIGLASAFISSSAIADCTFDGFCRDDVLGPSSTKVKNEAIASILTVTVLAGVGVWYLMSDSGDGNIHNYKTTDLSTTNKSYRFSLVPTFEGDKNGLAIQFSYAF
jgi:hypothetical protein